MKKLFLALAILISPTAFAQTIDYSVLADGHGHGYHKMHRCLKNAWKASEPTDQQKDSAKRFMEEAKAIKDHHMSAIKSAKEALKAAWSKHPVVQAEVVAAEDSLREHKTPVKAAYRDAGINTLNLLSNEQRADFDATFKSCMK